MANMKYRFSIQKYIQWSPRVKVKEKVVFVTADSGKDAYSQIEKDFPGWGISMFWPVWP
jgi:hypothetical protein